MLPSKALGRFRTLSLSGWGRLAGSGRAPAPGPQLWVLPGWQVQAPPDAGAKAPTLVLSRGLLRHAFWPIKETNPALLLAALEVQLLAWAPFEESAFMLCPGPAGVVVLAWDARRAAELQGGWQQHDALEGVQQGRREARQEDLQDFRFSLRQWLGAYLPHQPASGLALLPEPFLYAPGSEGVRLLACQAGVEGQVWRQGQLVASRWWAEMPAPVEWLNFQRGAAVPAELQQPEVVLPLRLELQASPWPGVTTYAALLQKNRFKWHLALAVGLSLLLLPSFWLLRQAWFADEALQVLAQEKAQLSQDAAPLIAAREAFERDFVVLGNLHKLSEKPNALLLLAHMTQVLEVQQVVLRELSWQSSDTLRFTLIPAQEGQRVKYIRALEDAGWLTDVREAADNMSNALVFEAKLRGLAPPPTDAVNDVGSDVKSAGESASGERQP